LLPEPAAAVEQNKPETITTGKQFPTAIIRWMQDLNQPMLIRWMR